MRQGYFDIFFPTDFAIMEDIYRAVTGRLTDVQSHEDFMKGWAHVDGAMTKNGENPLLSFYKKRERHDDSVVRMLQPAS